MSKVYYMKHQPKARVVANLGFVSELMPIESAKNYAKLLRFLGNENVRLVKYG